MGEWIEKFALLSWRCSEITAEAVKFATLLKANDFLDLLNQVSYQCNLISPLAELLPWCEEAHAELKANDVGIVYPGHPDYPVNLLSVDRPPPVLTFWGEPIWNQRFGLAIVGSRHADPSTLLWLDREIGLLMESSRLSFYTLSGGARGVDQKIHSLSLRKNCPTVCMVPAGLDRLYPSDLIHWREDICRGGGAVVSIFPFGEPMQKSFFHRRNRVIAALSDVCLVAQAGRKSGSALTGSLATRIHKPVCALPFFPLHGQGGGNLDLIASGAQMIRDHEDLLMFMGMNQKNHSLFLSSRVPQRPDGEPQEQPIDRPHGKGGW